MAENAAEEPQIKVIVKKKKGGGHGHHGGGWKVAFADFMTAMMALFLVLWIMSQSQEVKQAVAFYFRHPSDYEGKPTPLLRGNQGILEPKKGRNANMTTIVESGAREGNIGKGKTPRSIAGGQGRQSADEAMRPQFVESTVDEMDELKDFLELKDLLWEKLKMDQSYELIKDQVTIEALEDGMVIQFMELPDRPLFKQNSREFTKPIQEAIAVMTAQLRKKKNKIEIDGHGPGLDRQANKWLASVELADLMRNEMSNNRYQEYKFIKIGSCADGRPLNPNNLNDLINRRISILVRPRQWRPERY